MVTQTTVVKGTLGERVKKLMELRGLTKTDLSRETGVPVATLSYLVDGSTYNPRIATLLAIANYLNASLDYLVLGIHSKDPNVDHSQRSIPLGGKIPLLDWDDVIFWCKYGHDFIKGGKFEWIIPHQETSEKAFALPIISQNEGVFLENSIIIIDPQEKYDPCDYVLVMGKDEKPVIRKISCEKNKLYFSSPNIDSALEEVTDNTQIFGKVIEYFMLLSQ